MKVAIDISRMHKLSRSRGIGVYAKNLYNSLRKLSGLEVGLIEEKTDYQKFDLIHFPFFDFFSHTLPLITARPVVVTIHDLIPIMFPQHYPPGIKGRIYWQLQKQALKNVRSIIAVSKTVKNDIENVFKIKPEKISVVYSAQSDRFQKIDDQKLLKNTKMKYKLPDEFALYIGNVNWNKNILNMTEAVLLTNKNLVIIGDAFLDKTNLNHPEKKSFKSWIENYGKNARIKILGSLPEQDVVRVMNLAGCLIFVSYYEGFGLPILEAQACSTPVLTSIASSMPEIAGKGAFLANPEIPLDIASGLKMIEQPEYREKLIWEGFKNLKRFSWEKTAIGTMKVYKDALS